MFERIGIVTNIWAKEIENGARFDELMVEFAANGFRDMEVREGDYLLNSEFGQMLQKLKAAMPEWTDAEYKAICDAIWEKTNFNANNMKHAKLFREISAFVQKASGLTLSYAMSYPWLSSSNEVRLETQTIVTAKKIAYLLSPSRARLRLVDLDTEGNIDEHAAVANLRKYISLLREYPMIFAVENARQSALLTLKLTVAGGVKLTYDEANTYRDDGTTLNSHEAFWNTVEMDNLTSVHFKQKTEAGVLSEIRNGYVDFKAITQRLRSINYSGDLLLENAPTPHSLVDALKSREYLQSI